MDTRIPENIRDLMHSQHLAVISTVGSDGQPQGATIFCVMHEDGVIFFPTRSASRKFRNIASQPQVALVINHPSEPVTVQLHGMASEVTEPTNIQHAIDHLMACTASDAVKKHWLPPVKRLHNGQFTIMQITPTWIRYSDFRDEEHTGEEFVREVTL